MTFFGFYYECNHQKTLNNFQGFTDESIKKRIGELKTLAIKLNTTYIMVY